MTGVTFVLGERLAELKSGGPWNRDEEGLYCSLIRVFEESSDDLSEVLPIATARARAECIARAAVKWYEDQRGISTSEGEHEYFCRCVTARILPTIYV